MSFTHGGRPKAGAELIRNKKAIILIGLNKLTTEGMGVGVENMAQFSTSFTHGGRPKAGAELTRNKRPVADFHVIFRHGRVCPGHPRGSACTRPKCLADRAPAV